LLSEARKPLKNPEIADISQQKDVSGRYEDTADAFDSEVGVSETLMGVNRLRKRLAKKCTGHVLEASCGTGRNLGYFDVGKKGNVESLTFVDLSPQMVDICKRKWLALYGDQTKLKSVMQVRFLTGSAIERMPPAPTKEKYDTIIQTMGLCSTPSPVELLTNLVRHLDVSNPDARILLLEHGRSYKDWLNRILDNAAEKHAEIHGCWFNRDIGALVEDAAKQTGLEIVNERRHHFGTTWVFELKPGPEAEKLASLAKTTPVGVEEKAHPATTWRSWFGLK
jgi:methyltransferase OMS1